MISLALLAGCTGASTDEESAPRPDASASPTPTASCASGAPSPTRVEFRTPYVEEEVAFDGGVAGAWLAQEHAFRSWTDMRIVAHRDMAWTGEPGFEVVTVDATNGSSTWLFTLRYELVGRCVEDRAAEEARLCTHWGEAANATRTSFDAAGGWSGVTGGGCTASGGA